MPQEIESLELKLHRRTKYIENGCWIWTGAANTSGYGVLLIGQHKGGNPRLMLVHRLSFLVAYGWLPDIVHHKCGVKLCRNPRHLEAKTGRRHALDHQRGLKFGTSKID
jgi:HNH endonuclease